MQENNVIRETDRGRNPATPFFALGGVTVAVAVIVAVVLVITFAVYFLA
jgi:hypothetical protein